MIQNDTYESAENTASQRQCNNTTRPNDYEDVDVPRTKPVILSKPTLGATAKEGAGKDVYAVVSKRSKPQSVPSTSADGNLYASVNKSKTTSRPSRPTSPGANGDPTAPPLAESRAVSNTKIKQKKETKPPKAKQDKGKKKDKKEEKMPLQMQQAKPEGAVYGNSPLSMNPIDTKVYENYAFQGDGTEYADGQNTAKSTTPEDSRTTNPDGLVYTTIAFSDNQLKKAQQPPPERETTEYAGIDFTRHAPPAQD